MFSMAFLRWPKSNLGPSIFRIPQQAEIIAKFKNREKFSPESDAQNREKKKFYFSNLRRGGFWLS